MSSKILFVFTSADKTLLGGPTGWYLPEAAHPYSILSPHFTIEFAAPKGPNPPVDPASLKAFADDTKFLEDAKDKFASTKTLSEVNVDDYIAVFYVGGAGPVLDLASDSTNAKLATEFYQKNKTIAAVCHGIAALNGAVDTHGKSIFVGRKFTGFSNAEEEAMGAVETIPFLLEDKMQALGGTYEKAAELFAPYVVVDGRLFTGQNPASAAPLAERLLAALKQ